MRVDGKRAVPFGIFVLCSLAAAQSPIDSVAQTVRSLRKYAESHSGIRGGLPELTEAKHQVRDWIESRLAAFSEKGDPVTLSNDFLAAFSKAGLFCDDQSDCPANSIGYLDEVQVHREHGFLIVTTAVGTGVRCGYDYSAYLYAWRQNQWRRVWENEQDDYSQVGYHPQTLHAVHISDAAADGTRLVLTLGTPAGCGGAFVPVYYRVWRVGANRSDSPLILDKSEILNDEGEPPAIGRITPDDLLIEFSAGGTGYGFTHKALRHYEIHGDKAAQIDPIAPTQRDFVEEWLDAHWEDSAKRSESAALREWHDKLHRDDLQGDYPEPTLRCSNDAALVEVTTHFEGMPKHYFLVRTKEPLHFTMANISDGPFPACTQPDSAADQQPSVLPANR